MIPVQLGVFKRTLNIALFEFTRFLLSKRGLVALVVYIAIWGVLLTQIISNGAGFIRSPHFQDAIEQLLGEAGFTQLSHWPVPELIVYWIIASISFPFFAMFSASDQLCTFYYLSPTSL